ERLRQRRAGGTGGGITHVADADIAEQFLHVPRVENIAHQAIALALVHAAERLGHHAGSVLTTVLKNGQRVVDLLVDVLLRNDSDNATHALSTPRPTGLFMLARAMTTDLSDDSYSLAGTCP